MNRARFLAAAVPSLLAVSLAGAPAWAAPAPSAFRPPVPHCLAPDGTDLNKLFDVKERIIGPEGCRTAFAKEKWVRTTPTWEVSGAAGAVYPEGYEPARVAPIDDFISKFVSATYVHDIGTPDEQSFTFSRNEVLRTGATNGGAYAVAVSPPFKALSVGTHTGTVFFTLTAEHCDGLGVDREENCLPEGTFAYTGDIPFDVVPRPKDGYPVDEKPDHGRPDHGKPDFHKPKPGKPDHGKPDHQKPDFHKPKPGKPDFKKPEHKKPDHEKPDYQKPDYHKPDPVKPDHKKPEPAKPDEKKPEDGKTDHKKPEPVKPDHGKPDPKKPEHGKPDHKKPEPSKPDEKKPDHEDGGEYRPFGF
ncbi:hypothetical protein [Streptomyces venezuelae]|uniref:hypothetical protein n=1 Tax=Streptomyces venezuelae TaxID=54571 RepID=UPI00123B6B35|nr:hypothetical protein [Streptomyces venezuelae]